MKKRRTILLIVLVLVATCSGCASTRPSDDVEVAEIRENLHAALDYMMDRARTAGELNARRATDHSALDPAYTEARLLEDIGFSLLRKEAELEQLCEELEENCCLGESEHRSPPTREPTEE